MMCPLYQETIGKNIIVDQQTVSGLYYSSKQNLITIKLFQGSGKNAIEVLRFMHSL